MTTKSSTHDSIAASNYPVETSSPEPAYSDLAAASSSSPPSPRPPPFSSLYFPSEPSSSAVQASKVLVTEPDPSTLPAFAPLAPVESPPAPPSPAEAEIKAALPQDTKGESSSTKGVDDGEPPPPYTEGSSPLEGFNYVMAAAGGAASIITQVQQGGPAPVNTLGGMSGCLESIARDCIDSRALDVNPEEHITLDLRYTPVHRWPT